MAVSLPLPPTPPGQPQRSRDRLPRMRPVLVALLGASSLLALAAPAGAGAGPGADAAAGPGTHRFRPAVAPGAAASGAARAADAPGVGAGAARQIGALQREKALRKPAQRKVSSQLLFTARMLRGEAATEGVPSLETGVELDAAGNLYVDISADVSDRLLRKLRAAGARVVSSHPRYHTVRAFVPPSQLEAVAGWSEVRSVRPRQEATTSRKRLGPPGAQGFEERAARVRDQVGAALPAAGAGEVAPGWPGSQVSEGDATHKADLARSTYGVSGAGLKIGVLSDGVESLAESQALGDLGDVTVLTVDGVVQTGRGDEGTAMLEIIHDLAPGARLTFATAFNGIASFADNIRALRAAGCDIIVDDVIYYVETRFQDGQAPGVISDTNGGIVAQAVNDVVADGALYFSAAGNEGNADGRSSGTYEGDFADGGDSPAVIGYGRAHRFAPGTAYDTIVHGSYGPIVLSWADPLGASSNDYDLYVLDSSGSSVVAVSNDFQGGAQDPVEYVSAFASVPDNRVVVVLHSGEPRYLHVTTNGGTLAVATAGATYGHSAARSGFGVAAAPAHRAIAPGYPIGPYPGVFNAASLLEPYSSDGPRRIFFQADGTPITPLDFTSTGGEVLQKPDFTAADGVAVTAVGDFYNPFFGTSAAAPHAAAIAALVKSARPDLAKADLVAALTGTAIDIGLPGRDRDSGAGILMAYEAIASLGAQPAANPNLGSVAAAENPGNGDGFISPGEGASVSVELNNTGVAVATATSATLTTTAPGVTVSSPSTSAYADLPAGAKGANLTPFTFTMASDAVCGAAVEFKLAVAYSGGPSPRVLSFEVPTGLPPIDVTNALGTVPSGVSGVTTASGTQVGRVWRDGESSTCGAAKAWPGFFERAGNRAYDSYTFTAVRSGCAVVQVTPPADASTSMFTAVYSPGFDPSHIDANYIGDSGGSHSVQRLAFQVTQGQTYTVVVHETNPGGAAGQSYQLRLPGCQIPPASALNQVPVALAHDVSVAPGLDGTANAAVDDGSYDPDGGTITVTQSPPGPYAAGQTAVLLTVVDEKGATAQASATVTVANPDGTADTTSGTGVASSVIGAGERGLTGCGSSGGPAPVALLGLAALAVFRGRRRAGASR